MPLTEVDQKVNNFAMEKVQDWWDLAWQLIAKYGRLVVTYNESDQGVDYIGQMYPRWWLSSPDVGFTIWSPKGPFVGVPDSGILAALPSSNGWTGWVTSCLTSIFAFVGVYFLGLRHGKATSEVNEFSYVVAP